MKNKKKKGFTIVELVIVIAIIAILAAVLIPTFASIINRANQSADIQAVRQMNMALLAESVENKPDGIEKVIKILDAAGFNAEDKLIPVSKGHSFYWYKDYNLIILVKDADGSKAAKLIFPVEDEEMVEAFSDLTDDWATATDGNFQVLFKLEDGKTYLSVNTETADAGDLSEINEAIANALKNDKSNVVININSNITVSEALTIGENVTVTFNLNGKTLTIGDAVAVASSETSGPSISVSGTLNINGGKIISTAGFVGGTSLGLVVGEHGTLNLNDTNLELIGDVGIQNNPGGTVNINGGVFAVAEDNLSEYNLLLYNIEGTMTVTGTSFLDKGTLIYAVNAPIYNVGGTIVMKSVSISSSGFCTAGAPSATAFGKITIDGNSTLTLTGEKKYIAPSGEHNAYNVYWGDPTDNNHGAFEYLGNSRDTTGFFFELKAACEGGGNIALRGDLTLKHSITVDKDFELDLAGHTLAFDYDYSDEAYSNFTGNGTVTIKGNGEVNIKNSFRDHITGSARLNVIGDKTGIVITSDDEYDVLKLALEAHSLGDQLKYCTIKSSKNELTVDSEGKLHLQSFINNLSGDLVITKNTTIDLGKINFNTFNHTIKINGCTLNIVGGEITESKFPFETEGDGKVIIDGTKIPINYLDEVVNSTAITANNVTAGNFTVNEEEGKTTLTLNAAETLKANLTVSNGNTLTINLNGNKLSTDERVITVSGVGSTLTVNGVDGVNDGTGTVSAGAVPFKTEKGGDMSLTNVTVSTTDQSFFLALLENVMRCNSASKITYDHLSVNKKEGKETTITIDQDIGNAHFKLTNEMSIPAGCDVTINLNDKELEVNTTLKVFGKLTIAKDPNKVGGGNLSCTDSIMVCEEGELVLNANQYTAGPAGNTVQDVSVLVDSDYVKVQDGYNKKVTKNKDGSAIVTAVAPT